MGIHALVIESGLYCADRSGFCWIRFNLWHTSHPSEADSETQTKFLSIFHQEFNDIMLLKPLKLLPRGRLGELHVLLFTLITQHCVTAFNYSHVFVFWNALSRVSRMPLWPIRRAVKPGRLSCHNSTTATHPTDDTRSLRAARQYSKQLACG